MKKILSVRTLSSIIMIAFIIGIIYITSQLGTFGNKWGIVGRSIGFVFIISLGIYVYIETVLVSIKKRISFLIFGIISIVLIFCINYNFVLNIIKTPNTFEEEFKSIFTWWTFIIPFIAIVPIMFLKNHDDQQTTNDIFFAIMLIILISLFIKIVWILTAIKWELIAFVLLTAIIFDSTAYGFGMTLGHKYIKFPFSPRLSPKKSWEGFIGGYICTMLFIGLFGYYAHIFQPLSHPYIWYTTAIIVLPGACQVGDLFFSSIKRTKDIKDFSSIIPGHGGVVDRIDGLIFVTIMFAVIFGVGLIGVDNITVYLTPINSGSAMNGVIN